MNRKLYRAPFFLVYSLLVLFSLSCGSSEFTEKDAKAQMSLLLPEVSGEGCLPILLERHDDVNSFVLVLDSRDKTVTGLKSKISKQLLEAGWESKKGLYIGKAVLAGPEGIRIVDLTEISETRCLLAVADFDRTRNEFLQWDGSERLGPVAWVWNQLLGRKSEFTKRAKDLERADN